MDSRLVYWSPAPPVVVSEPTALGGAPRPELPVWSVCLLLLLLLLRDAAASGQEGERANEHLASQADLLLVLMLQLLCAAPL